MEINKNSNINFGARKILTSTQNFKKGVENTVEVFLLKKGEDDSFVRTCINGLNQNKERLTTKQRKLKTMFQSFNKEGKDNDLFVAIKNGEQITGAINVPYYEYWICTQNLVNLTENKQTNYSLWNAMINKVKGNINTIRAKYFIEPSLEKATPSKSENIKFNSNSEQKNINLLDYLDIDFQDRVH